MAEKIDLQLIFQPMHGVLDLGWYKAPLSYMIYSAYYCPPFVKVGPYCNDMYEEDGKITLPAVVEKCKQAYPIIWDLRAVPIY